MSTVSTILRILGGAVSAYMILCFARLMLSWFPGGERGTGARLLLRITEPYLAPFRRIAFLRGSGMDFSPMAALAVLAGVSWALGYAAAGALTVGTLLALAVRVAWYPAGFLLGFFAVLILARIVAYLARWNSLHPAWRAVDAMINPVLLLVKRVVYRNRIVNYMQGLLTGLLVTAGLRLLLGWLFGMLFAILEKL